MYTEKKTTCHLGVQFGEQPVYVHGPVPRPVQQVQRVHQAEGLPPADQQARLAQI